MVKWLKCFFFFQIIWSFFHRYIKRSVWRRLLRIAFILWYFFSVIIYNDNLNYLLHIRSSTIFLLYSLYVSTVTDFNFYFEGFFFADEVAPPLIHFSFRLIFYHLRAFFLTLFCWPLKCKILFFHFQFIYAELPDEILIFSINLSVPLIVSLVISRFMF